MIPTETEHRAQADALEQARTQTCRRILVALNGNCDPRPALAVARLLATALRTPLHGLFAWHSPLAASEVPRLIGVAPEFFEGIVIDVEVGEPSERIAYAAKAEPGSIVVLPADPVGATDELGLGEVAARTIIESACAVVVVREGMTVPTQFSTILLPLDGTPSTASAIAPIGALARNAAAAVAIVVVGQANVCASDEPGSMKPPRYVDQPHHEWSAYADEFLQRFAQAIGHIPEGVATRLFVGAGDAASEILRFSREVRADLAVLVWHGDLGEHHGAVFRRVLEASVCPVLILKCHRE